MDFIARSGRGAEVGACIIVVVEVVEGIRVCLSVVGEILRFVMRVWRNVAEMCMKWN